MLINKAAFIPKIFNLQDAVEELVVLPQTWQKMVGFDGPFF